MKYKITWEDTIRYIRTKKDYAWLVEKAYLEEDLILNVKRFMQSDEFSETLLILRREIPESKSILDIGAGNGTTSIAFALAGYNVTVIEPNSSDTIGVGAVAKLKEYFKISNLHIYNSFVEDINFPNNTFDIIYTRQCMHHANDLKIFVSQSTKALKKGGVFFSVRDHVVFNAKDKQLFLNNHPLQQFYGGENAFSSKDYKFAIKNAGLFLKMEFKYFDNVINYSPKSSIEIAEMKNKVFEIRLLKFNKYFGKYSKFPFLFDLYNFALNVKVGNQFSEIKIPGRMYSYLAKKI
jgi:SAM-dependent methyltransferase